MKHFPHKNPVFSQKSFLDDSSSLTSSTITRRITRKQDQKSLSRRSISRNSSSASQQTMDISKFYVKMTPTKCQKESEPVRPTLLRRTEATIKFKKRSPTPASSRLKKERQISKTAKKEDPIHIESQLLIIDLQRRCEQLQETNQELEKTIMKISEQLELKNENIIKLQQKNHDLIQKQQKSSKKLMQYQQIVSLNELNLTEVRTSLQKLKNIIQRNRYNQLQSQNSKLKKQNYQLRIQIISLNSENKEIKDKILHLQNQINSIQMQNIKLNKIIKFNQKDRDKQNSKNYNNFNKNQKQQQLEKLILQKSQSELKFKMKAQKLQINLAYLNRKRNQQIDKMKTKHKQEIQRMRNKICIMHSQCNQLRLECQKLKNKNLFSSALIQRRGLTIPEQKNNDDYFLFDLSP